MAAIHVTDIEAAINHWRERAPSPDGVTLAPELRALAEVYALLVFHHEDEADEATMPQPAREAWLAWYRSTPDTPCIAICSTAQGDAVCKGCGRTDDEVQRWTELSLAAKRAVWRRITQDGSAWRFNRYAERAAERGGATQGASGAAELTGGRAAEGRENPSANPVANPAANQSDFVAAAAPARSARPA